MSDVAQLMRAANPVPDSEAALPDDEFDVLLLLTQSRSGIVDVRELTKPVEPEKKQRSGWLVAAVAFAVVIMLVGAVMLLANPAEDLPPASTPLTEVVPPEVEPVAESTVVAPIDVAEAWFALYEAGDVAGYQALMSADATFSCADCTGGTGLTLDGPYFDYPLRALAAEDAADSRTLYAGHGSLNATCTADGNVVTCDTERASLFGWFDEEGEPQTYQRATRVFTVEDGVVTEYGFCHRTIPRTMPSSSSAPRSSSTTPSKLSATVCSSRTGLPPRRAECREGGGPHTQASGVELGRIWRNSTPERGQVKVRPELFVAILTREPSVRAPSRTRVARGFATAVCNRRLRGRAP